MAFAIPIMINSGGPNLSATGKAWEAPAPRPRFPASAAFPPLTKTRYFNIP
jgi:hypothetical protein